ncbi:MAG: hypothetical protein AB7O59_05020 [Pirellulales bacterium]
MPATEQTWRDSKLLHLVFGLTAVAMLATTVWMLAADHRREWKDYQNKFQDLEAWTAQARISQEQSTAYTDTQKELEEKLAATQRVVPDPAVIVRFEDAVRRDAAARKAAEPSFTELEAAFDQLSKAEEEARPALRNRLRSALEAFVRQAKFREDEAATEKKFLAADLEVARSQYDLGVGNELPKSRLAELQKAVDEQMDRVAAATDKAQDATTYRKELDGYYGEIFGAEEEAKKQLADHQAGLKQLQATLWDRENHITKDIVELPILDAFGRPIKIEQVWLPKLTINYNFGAVGDVARFDRCVTCHQAIAESAPGSATEPRYRAEHRVTLTMQTPEQKPEALAEVPEDSEARGTFYGRQLEAIYGIQLAGRGVFDPDEAKVSVVRSETLGAKAGLEMGDVIERVNDVTILDKRMIYAPLLDAVTWGQPVSLTVRRGVPHPYASHPRLDLFAGSLSPHKKDDIGCTICHDGQGSATAFKWASHSPDDPFQEAEWRRKYDWFDNHHWIYPMMPKRFSESLCLKCHHDVTELAASERFPDPPAPKLMQGFQLIQDFGCFGCHEINGFDGPHKRIGPDLRTEPPYSAAALELLAGGGLTDQQAGWARELALEPGNDQARRALGGSLAQQGKAGTLPGADPIRTKKLVNLLDELDTPGKLRRVGPSLRHVASKNDFEFLYSWIRQPSDFRPTTKMPQFFGLESHLGGEGLAETRRYEPIEIRSAAEYLLAKSQPFEYTAPPKDVKVEPSTARGKQLFEVRGCLACHMHADFPAGKMTQGPDLSRMGAKLSHHGAKDGRQWLYTWLKNPNKYHPRTFMPNLLLEPLEAAEDPANPMAKPVLTDPAADITAFLMESQQDWRPTNVPQRELTAEESKALKSLALEHLQTAFTRRQAEKYLETGIPEDRKSELKGDEVELVGPMSTEKQLQYVGRRTLSKYGCSGCHDIPGFEDVKPIGTGLADWGRKSADRLAFEQIIEYLKHGHGKPGSFEPHTSGDVTDKQIEETDEGAYGATHFNFEDLDPATGYFMEKLFGHQREGFIWQKLREPRSYDYQKVQNKSYNERLRMPQFTALNDEQREAIITFVLGLVAEPPPPQYVYRGTPQRDAVVQGWQVIEKFNCTGCHAFDLNRWDLAYEAGDFSEAPDIPDFEFLKVHFSPEEVAASQKPDAAGKLHATLVGMPVVDESGKPLRLDVDGAPIEADDTTTPAFYSFTPWKSVLINGQVRQAGVQNLLVPESRITKRYPPVGGTLPELAYSAVVTAERAVNPQAKPEEAWGWLPPPLVNEGTKVQSAWLYDFLLDPYPIRPAVVLRMPKFNMSPDDARKLVNYFAAVDKADYPYDFDPRTRESHLAAADAEHPHRLEDALKIVTDGNYCVKCHLVGDFTPEGSDRAKAPQLDRVFRRLRPDFVLDWVANPKRLLPYTGMPVNIPHDKGVSQELYKGTPDQQLNALVDLLMNFDRFTESKTSIKPYVKPVAPAPAAAADNQPLPGEPGTGPQAGQPAPTTSGGPAQ